MRLGRLLAVAVLAAAAVQTTRGQQDGVFRARADAVVLSVAVRDRNRPVSGLTAADFQLLDNNVAQEISSTSVDQVPVDVALVLDTSGSLDGPAFAKLKTDIQKMADLLKADDRVRLITFGSRVNDELGLQPGTASLPLERLSAGGRTSLYDALATALMIAPNADRPQLVFAVSDGIDTRSYFTPAQIEVLAGYSSATLYMAFLPTPVPSLPAENLRVMVQISESVLAQERARRVLGGVVKAGGGVVFVPRVNEALPDVFQKVLEDFRTMYVLRYTPRGVSERGWHEIQVSVPKRGNFTVRARKGYGSY